MTAYNELLRFLLSTLPETAMAHTMPHGYLIVLTPSSAGGGGRGEEKSQDVVEMLPVGQKR